MAIVNATPDSFHSESRVNSVASALLMVEKHLTEGADIIDVGGQSTRPNAKLVGEQEELNRVLPVIEAIHKQFASAIISVDTFYSSVAKASIESGAHIVNDVSFGTGDVDMFETVAELKVPYILTHSTGSFGSEKGLTSDQSATLAVFDALFGRLVQLRKMGVADVIVDLGFGFGKSIDQNFELLQKLNHFKHLNAPILVGVSRKSMIWKTLEIEPFETLSATSALHLQALQNGAHCLRVHDTKEAVQCIQLFKKLKQHVG